MITFVTLRKADESIASLSFLIAYPETVPRGHTHLGMQVFFLIAPDGPHISLVQLCVRRKSHVQLKLLCRETAPNRCIVMIVILDRCFPRNEAENSGWRSASLVS